MMPIRARGVYIKREAFEDPRSMARVNRMLPFIRCETAPQVIDDAGLHQVVIAERLNHLPRHGRQGAEVRPVVIFNQFLYGHTPAERAERERKYPELFRSWLLMYAGYGGWDWRRSGDEEYRRTTGLVCQPAYAIHSFWGCHFRCAYCNLGHVANAYVNLEDWIAHLAAGLASPQNSPSQRLFQWDNGTDVVCWEPEYGGTRLLVELFATRPDQWLELYVGKSDNVDYLLDYDHKGHTVCCWSLGTEPQCRQCEPGTAGMEARLASARKCQQAGYTVRIRLSPMTPDVVTMEPLRFCTHERLVRDFEPGLLDPEFMQAMADIPADAEEWQKSEFPDALRVAMYRVVLDEVARISPRTPVALCREKRRVWDTLAEDLRRMGQSPDDFVCNCGPESAGDDWRLRAATA
ncbi:MAG: Spore photoproduct lyase [Lentisphaerae bacterium ADurb.BinA184]|nr:MAG: Spore photoproduct lyase [Lentisphaerae bacterium ADurb.BinA184]